MFKPRIFSTMLLAVAIALTFGARNASADLLDPLHGYVKGDPGAVDNGTNTPTTVNPLQNFGFTISPGPKTGDVLLDVLVPNNVAPSLLPFHVTGTASGTAALFSMTAWTSGQLDSYLGISATPANPIGAYTGASSTLLGSPVTGFFVYQVDLGTLTLKDASLPNLSPLLNITEALPLASYVVAFLNKGTATNPDWIATANSGALLETAPPPQQPSPTPEPSTLAVATLGALGFMGYGLRRRLKK